jgi:D-beta-D-heptose 7-phosphate kinase/D-beta-D-heptose 1-phosphate adenosyltransferase
VSTRPVVVVVGDVLLDRDVQGCVERVCPDAPVPVVDVESERPRPGGAGLAAVLSAIDGRDVVLVTALADDEGGFELAQLLAGAGVQVVDLGQAGSTVEKTRVRAGGTSLVRIDRGRPGDIGPWTRQATEALASAGAVLVADYGNGVADHSDVRDALTALPGRLPVVWDPHPRGPAPVAGVRLATPNRQEATSFAGDVAGEGLTGHTARARALLDRWRAASVAVTLGAEGALLVSGDVPPLVVPARPVEGDPCGAGDRFSSAAAGLLADGALPSDAVIGAVDAASSFVETGGAASVRCAPSPSAPARPRDAFTLAEEVRRRGGTVVTTGGCFDLLHAGHVGMLRAARALGDCLVVCLNSDASVRRLKGPGRPVVGLADRVAVLLALECVDAVAVFDEDTPLALLDQLRPDVFAKGADYSVADLPEADLLRTWGGQAVVLPYLEGRSTSRLVEEVGAARRS